MRLIITRQSHFKNIFFSLVFVFATISSSAQILKPVQWTIESKKLNDNEFEIIYTAKIDNGWHLYSQFIKPNGPNPTGFNLERSTRFTQIGKVTEEKGYVVYEEMFNMEVKQFKDKAVFKQKIKKTENEKVNIIGEIDFMSCNGSSCTVGSFDIDIDI